MKKQKLNQFTKHKRRNLKYDFLPSMLEIIEKPENKMASFIIIVILLLLVTTVVWAAWARVDIIITAPGSIMPEGNLISVQTLYGGMVSEIYTEDGQYINRGDRVMVLDTSEEESKLEQLQYELRILHIQQEVYGQLNVEEDGSTINTSVYGENSSIADAIVAEQKLFTIEIQEYELSKKSSDNDSLIDNQKESFIAERVLTLAQNMNSLAVKIHEKEAEIKDCRRIIEAKLVTAPESGIITNQQVNVVGGILSVGQVIAYVIPEDDQLMFVAYVPSGDIEAVHVGDEVRIKVNALENTDYEIVTGTVAKIGDLALNIEGFGSAYKVDLSMDSVPNEVLKVGTEGNCDIISGNRSVLEYFIEPFIEGLNDSLHER